MGVSMRFKTQASLAIVFLLSMCSMVWGVTLLTENFDYTAGTLLTAVAPGGPAWNITGTTATPNLAVVAGGLSYANYPTESVVGNAVGLATSGQDCNKTFTALTAGTVYSSFLINVTSATTTGDYVLHFGQSVINTGFYGRVFVKKDASNNLLFGLTYNTAETAAVWTAANYSLNATYLVVLKYEILSGTTNDKVSLFVNPAFPGNEPTALLSFVNAGTDPTNIGCVALRQGAANKAAACIIDGIRVAATWADLFPSALAAEPTAQPTVLAFSNIASGSFDMAFTAASPTAAGYLAVRKSGSAPTTDPVDGIAYTAGNTLGDGTVVYSGSSVSFPQTLLSPSTTYYYKIYSFNGSSTTTNYLVTSPLAGNQATSAGVVLPTVVTAAITPGTITAFGGGEVTADGNATVTARGVCWNTTGTPTITADSFTTNSGGIGVFTSTLSPLAPYQQYFVRAYATNSAGTAYGSPVTFTSLKNEPSNHVTAFTSASTTATTVRLTWVDATADAYLIKGSSVSYLSIVDPVDGVAETNAALISNVTQGTQAYTFTGLSGSTTYYFKIYSYNNSGTGINYKTDGSVPQAAGVTTAAPSASVSLCPAYLDISSATSEGAVQMTLANYSGNDVKYRLYNPISSQYNCWDATTNAYISSATYSNGPQVPGTPSTSSTFWIMYQCGGNLTTIASYRDRLNPYTGTNYQTTALSAMTSITSPFTLSGKYWGITGYPLSNKYVVLAYSGLTLISAASTTLTTGALSVVCPSGTTINRIEIRDALNNLVMSEVGSWTANTTGLSFPANYIPPTVQTTVSTGVGVTITSTSTGNGLVYDNTWTPTIVTPILNPVFVTSASFSLVGTGNVIFTVTSSSPYGAYWQTGAWHTVLGVAGVITFPTINFDGKGLIPVILGDGDPSTLPVELSSFTAILTAQNFVNLTWTTQSETDMSGFYIYRSKTAELADAEVITPLIAATNTSSEQVYLYQDTEAENNATYNYWLEATELNNSSAFHGPITVTLGDGGEIVPPPLVDTKTCIDKIYPNPFNPRTEIAYNLKTGANVTLAVYNHKGQLIRTLVNADKVSGYHRVTWDGNDSHGAACASGVYYVKMQAGSIASTGKLVLMK